MTSLRAGLIKALLTVFLPVLLLSGLASYWLVMIEVDEIYEQQLTELATPLLALDTARIAATLAHRGGAGNPGDDDNEMAVLVWSRKGALLYGSDGAPAVEAPAALKGGESFKQTFIWHGARWRAHWYLQPESDRWVTVLRPLMERDELGLALGIGLGLPSVLAVLLMLPLGSWAIRQGLRPLQEVGRQLASRRSHDLSTIDDAKVAREVVPLVDEINGLLGRLDQAMVAEKRFTADASHELRTPLAAVQAHIEVALGSSQEADRHQALHRALKGLTQATELTEQLLLLARLDHQMLENDLSEARTHLPGWSPQLDLREVLRDLSAQHGVAALGKGVDLSLDLPQVPCRVEGWQAWLRVAIGNVLSNAVKFTPASGTIEVRMRQGPQGVEIEVKDSGPGMKAEQVALLGLRFFRGNHEVPGAGLGLSIASRITSLHGGELRFAVDQGLRVTMVLPQGGA
jgi:signal transduction histidine kinase